MEIVIYILIAIGGIVALWLIFRFLGGCLWRILLAFAVLVLIGFIIFYMFRC